MLSTDARGAVALGRVVNRAEASAQGVPVDVVDLAAVAPALAVRVVHEGRPLVDREPEARLVWAVAANQRALDIEPWLAEAERLRNEALRRRAGLMVGEDKARRLLTELLGSTADLKRYRERVTREELRASRDAQHMVLHALYVAT